VPSDVRIRILADNQATPAFRQVQNSIRETESVGKSVFSRLGSFITSSFQTAIGFVTGNLLVQLQTQLSNLGKQAFEAVTSFEVLQITLEGAVAREMVRSSKGTLTMADALSQASGKTKELIKWLQDLAIRSPYATDTVIQSFLQFTRYGMPIEKAKELSDALLQIGAGSGLTEENLKGAALALSQISGADKILTQDLRQLMNAGIDVRSILDELGLSFSDLAKDQDKVKVSTKDFIKKFIEISKRDYAGSVDRLAKSWSGLKGALSDVKNVGLRNLFGGVLEVLQPVVQKFTEWMLGPGMDRLKTMGQNLAIVAQRMVGLGQTLFQFGFFSRPFRDALARISKDAAGLYDKVAPGLKTFLDNVRTTFDKVREAIQVGKDEGFFSENFKKKLEDINPTLAKAYENMEPTLQNIIDKFNEVKTTVENTFTEENKQKVQNWFTENRDSILKFLEAFGVLSGTLLIGRLVLTGLPALIGAINWPILGVIAAISLLSLAWATDWAGMRTQITAFYNEDLAPTVDKIKQKLGEIKISSKDTQTAIQILGGVWTYVTDDMSTKISVARNIAGAELALLRGDFDTAKSRIRSAIDGIVDFLDKWIGHPIFHSDVFRKFYQSQKEIWKDLPGTWEKVKQGLETTAQLLGNKILEWTEKWRQPFIRFHTETVPTLTENIRTAFQTGLDKVRNQIETWKLDVIQKWESLKERARNIFQDIVDTIAGFFSVDKWVSIGSNIVSGLTKGISGNTQNLYNSAKNSVSGTVTNVKKLLKMKSPSKVFEDIGKNMVLGMQLGFRKPLQLAPNLQLAMPAPLPYAQPTPPIQVTVNANVSSDLDVYRIARQIAEEFYKQSKQARSVL